MALWLGSRRTNFLFRPNTWASKISAQPASALTSYFSDISPVHSSHRTRCVDARQRSRKFEFDATRSLWVWTLTTLVWFDALGVLAVRCVWFVALVVHVLIFSFIFTSFYMYREYDFTIQGGVKNGAILSHCKYSENFMTELRENCWTSAKLYAELFCICTVINFLFKNVIVLAPPSENTATVWCSNLFVQCE